MSKPTWRTYAFRAVLIAAIAAGVLLFGFAQGRAVLGPGSLAPLSGPPRVTASVGFEPLPGSRVVHSYDVRFNGQPATFAQFTSSRPASEVIEQFEARYGEPTAQASPTEGTMVRAVTPTYAVAGALDSEGRTVGLVAFDHGQRRGSTYFIGRGARPRDGWRHGDVPGEEVAGIPRPLRSRRTLCVEGLGGIPSRLLLYEGYGPIGDNVELFATEMPQAGWTRNGDVERVIQKRLPDGARFLSFLKGTERAMMYLERDRSTGKVRIAVVYSVKDWLPPDRGL
ncbi:MAG: hypothetical protein ACLF0G_13560 [Candidatus Brocadiia bacterium]